MDIARRKLLARPERDSLFIYNSFLPDIPYTPPFPGAVESETVRLAREAGIDLAADQDWLSNNPTRAAHLHAPVGKGTQVGSLPVGQPSVAVRVVDPQMTDGWAVALVALHPGCLSLVRNPACVIPCLRRAATYCRCNSAALELLWGETYSSEHANAVLRRLVVPKAARNALNHGGWFYRFSRIGDKPGRRGGVTWAAAAARG